MLRYKTAGGTVSAVLRETNTSVIASKGALPAQRVCQRNYGSEFNGDKIICGDGAQGHRYCYVMPPFFLTCEGLKTTVKPVHFNAKIKEERNLAVIQQPQGI